MNYPVEQQQNTIETLPPHTKSPWAPKHRTIPFGHTNKDLYDEDLAQAYRKDAFAVARATGFAIASLVASWAFACMPQALLLEQSWNANGSFISSVPLVYDTFRGRAALLLSFLSFLLFALSSLRASYLKIEYLYEDLPTSATIFDGQSEGLKGKPLARTIAAIALFYTIALASVWASAPHGLLWGTTYEWLCHVVLSACLSISSGLMAGCIAFSTLTSRWYHIDTYCDLVPETDADDDYKVRIYADHSHGVAKLVGKGLTLLALSTLLVSRQRIAGLGLLDGSYTEAVSQLPSFVMLPYWFCRALSRLAPPVLTVVGIVVLINAFLCQVRFVTEWSLNSVPERPASLSTTREKIVASATGSVLACFAIRLLTLGVVVWARSLGNDLYLSCVTDVVDVMGAILVLIAAGRFVGQVTEHLLLSDAAYSLSHSYLYLMNGCEEMFLALKGLQFIRMVLFFIMLISLLASASALRALIYGITISSWRDLFRYVFFILLPIG